MEISITYLSLGSNLGDRIEFLRKAIQELNKIGKVHRCSKVYETPAWGFESEDDFLNICLEFHTELPPLELLNGINNIERSLGRVRKENTGYQSRPIDIDIIFFDDLNLNLQNLKIPHPEYSKRNFVLLPLMDLVPDRIDSFFGKSIKSLLDELANKGNIKCLQIPVIC
jgi:2-amino-4-hydroxy-6-hydroxymethyldihydropteridine diphosphokinase